MFSKSKVITSPNITTIFKILINQLSTSIFVLDKPFQVVVATPMSTKQSMVLKGAYTMI